ncbi:MAG: PAS domain-containing protein [Ktedonobacteraceae bacterium]|nr:PAS domain-containing protein [Ktedonobacteraceae bacterium]
MGQDEKPEGKRTAQGISSPVGFVEDELDFRELVDALPHFIWVIRLDGTAEFFSRPWFEYTGLTLEQTQNNGWMSIIHPDDQERCVALLQESARTGMTHKFEYRVKNVTDGTYRWFLAHAFPHKDAHGTILHWYGTATDIEEQKQAEELLMQTNEYQRQFVSMVSHEFRTTLTTIEGFSEVLQEAEFSAEEVKDFARDIYTDAVRLHRMIDDLLDLEKMQSGRLVLQREMIDFNALLKSIAERMSTVSPFHVLLLELDEKLPDLWLDPDKMTQVLMNLLSNAIKYSPNGGEISLRNVIEGNTLRVSVKDAGIGIPTENIEQIFTPYNRIHSKKTQFIHGTGLGLAIVRRLIELHGGKVWVESVPMQGSTFHFTLPIIQNR